MKKRFLICAISVIVVMSLGVSLVGCGDDEDVLIGSWKNMSSSAGAVIDNSGDLTIKKSDGGLMYNDEDFIGDVEFDGSLLSFTPTEGIGERNQSILEKEQRLEIANEREYIIVAGRFLVNENDYFRAQFVGEFKPGSKMDCDIRIDYSKADYGTSYQSVAYEDGFIELSNDGTCEFEGEFANTSFGSTQTLRYFYEGTYEVYENVIVMSLRDNANDDYFCAFYIGGNNIYNNIYMKSLHI